MRHRFTADSHVHSKNSFDADSSVAEQLKRADELGLDYLTVTDHFESAFYYKPDSEFGDQPSLLRQSASDIESARKSNVSKTELLCGIELGEPLHDIRATEDALAIADYDFILCSTHNLKDMGDFFWLDYHREAIPELLKKYFSELCECIEWGRFDSLAHITYPLRYICGRAGIQIDMNDYKAEIDEALSLLAKGERALEFNTCRNPELSSSCMDDCRDVYFLRRFIELGGRYITLGSDAHKAEDLAKGIDGALDILSELGVKEIAVYKKREPHMLPIV